MHSFPGGPLSFQQAEGQMTLAERPHLAKGHALLLVR